MALPGMYGGDLDDDYTLDISPSRHRHSSYSSVVRSIGANDPHSRSQSRSQNRRDNYFGQQRVSARSGSQSGFSPTQTVSRPHSSSQLRPQSRGNITNSDYVPSSYNPDDTSSDDAAPPPVIGRSRTSLPSRDGRAPTPKRWSDKSRDTTRPQSRRQTAGTIRSEDLTEVAAPPPVQDEDSSGQWRKEEHLESAEQHTQEPQTSPFLSGGRRTAIATQLYIISYLIFFSIWGTLARLGIQWLTFYPGAPATTPVLWANFAGSLFMGFLSEDRKLFQQEWGVPKPLYPPPDSAAHSKVKKTIPLYIGLATGFCGSLTSFSSFARDAFLSLSNDLPSPIYHPSTPTPPTYTTSPRHNGYSVEALLATIILEVSVSLSALYIGAHLALFLHPFTPTIPFRLTRRFLDPLFVLLGLGSWIAAVALASLPPHAQWRMDFLFALVFAPLGCLLRYLLSIYLNPIIPSFPLGTFAANIFGTAVLGMSYDLQHVKYSFKLGAVGGNRITCQVLQGVIDGFCGCVTTVSTWVAELKGLRRQNAWVYGASSVVVAVGLLVGVMGSVRWGVGWGVPVCET